ncbi:MAG: hypothetical protein EGQ57_03600 [Alphaproteobacteria bacterium]|nr:hypothetical protein [Alphaproteobacteria bacterium]
MYLAEIFYSLKYFCFMDSIIFIVAAVYVCILIVLGGYCSYRRFREMTGNSLSERKDTDLFVLRNYFDAGLVPKMPRIALVECLTVLGLFLSLTAAPDGEIFTAGAMQFAWVLVLSLGTAFLSVRIVIFLSQFLVDICFVLFLTVIAAVLLIGRRRMRLWK